MSSGILILIVVAGLASSDPLPAPIDPIVGPMCGNVQSIAIKSPPKVQLEPVGCSQASTSASASKSMQVAEFDSESQRAVAQRLLELLQKLCEVWTRNDKPTVT